jgi:hypothetical protein
MEMLAFSNVTPQKMRRRNVVPDNQLVHKGLSISQVPQKGSQERFFMIMTMQVTGDGPTGSVNCVLEPKFSLGSIRNDDKTSLVFTKCGG